MKVPEKFVQVQPLEFYACMGWAEAKSYPASVGTEFCTSNGLVGLDARGGRYYVDRSVHSTLRHMLENES